MSKYLNELIDKACENYSTAKRIAVENFCISAYPEWVANRVNLKQDAQSYKWNDDAVNTIKQVLSEVGRI